MSIFEYVKGLFKRLIKKLMKRRQVIKDVVLSEEQKLKLNPKQQKVIVEGMRIGLDMRRIAKPKYSPEQMAVLSYGLMLGLDIGAFDSYTMSPSEMEYHLFLEAIDKYLGRNYLKNILATGDYSIADNYVQNKIKAELMQSLTLAFGEVASTVLLEEDLESEEVIQKESEVETVVADVIEPEVEILQEIIPEKEIVIDVNSEEDDFYDMLINMCEDRSIDSSSLKKTTITQMIYDYEQLEKDYAQILDKRCVALKKIQDYSMEPSLLTILKGRSIEDKVLPIKLYSQGKLLNEFFQVNDGNHIYLCRKKYITIKIR